MAILDLWAKLSEAKLDWAYEAQRRFVASFQDERVKQLYKVNRQKDIFVAVFGPSQVGKTSLILRLIGVAQEHMAAVDQALRGGREEGRSSTVTSMLYAASPDQNYYVKGASDADWILCEEEEQVSEKMRLLREEVEASPVYSIHPVEVRIPEHYFIPGLRSDLLVRMMDLPGIYSSTPEEQDHVMRVIHHYLPQANMVLLVNQAKQMASFQHFGIDAIDEWRFNPDKFRIVLTHSVSANSIREMLREVAPEELHKHFYEEFDRTIERFPKGEIQVYPLEYGKSWEQLGKKGQPWFEPYNRHMEELFNRLREDINASANEYSQVRMNYRLYRSVEEKLREKEAWFEEGRRVLESRIRELEEHREELLTYLHKATDEFYEMTQLVQSLEVMEPQPALEPLPSYKGYDKSVSRLRYVLHDRVDQMVREVEYAIDSYENLVEDILGIYPGQYISPRHPIRRMKAGDMDGTIRELLVRLNGYMLDTYYTSNWERDVDKLNEVILQLHSTGAGYVASAVKEDTEQLLLAVRKRQRKLQLKVKETENRVDVQQRELAVIGKELVAHEARFESFRKQADRDKATARSFRLYVDQCFHQAYTDAVATINSEQTGSAYKWMYLMNLQNLLNEYRKLTEEVRG